MENQYLDLISEHSSVDDPDRKKVCIDVLSKIHESKDSLDQLACAYSSLYIGAAMRPEALIYFERYLEHSLEYKRYNYFVIYLDFAKAYEAELDFDNAEKFYILSYEYLKRYSVSPILNPNIPLGRLYLKMGVQKAIEFWEAQKSSQEYISDNSRDFMFRRSVDYELRKAIEKQQKGYVYRPRKKK